MPASHSRRWTSSVTFGISAFPPPERLRGSSAAQVARARKTIIQIQSCEAARAGGAAKQGVRDVGGKTFTSRSAAGLLQPTSSHAPTRPRPDEESLFEQKRSEMTACDQRLEVPFDSIGDQGAGHSDPDLDVAQLGGLGEIC
jgi:hypothetical protein